MKKLTLSIMVLMFCFGLRAQTTNGFPVMGRVSYNAILATSFSFTNQTPTTLEVIINGGSSWYLTKDGLTQINPNSPPYFLLQSLDSFQITFPIGGGPFICTNAAPATTFCVTNAVFLNPPRNVAVYAKLEPSH
jgi:hypothetical protein